MGDAHLLGPFDGTRLQRALPDQPGQGADGALHRLRPAHPDRVRPRRPRGGRRGRQGGRPGGASGPHEGAARGHPRGVDEHLHDDQRHRGVAARALRGPRPGQGRRPRAAGGHDAERHRQGVPEPGDLHLPARPEPAPHRRHHRLHGAPGAQVEPDQRLQLPPPRGRRHAGPGDRLRAGHGHRGARRGAGLGQDRARRAARRRRSHQLLRELERALRGGDRQNAGLHPAVGPHLPPSATGSRTPSCAASVTACR